ncbi:MAG: hypothetical protein VKN13_06940 [Cyanobacteriota bacterium]|nr:hypothetical protein [Cyanobacteriota bacterium]
MTISSDISPTLAGTPQASSPRSRLMFWLGMAVAVGLPVYLVTHHLMATYDLADSEHYISFWRKASAVASTAGLADLNDTQVLTLGSQDPGYTLLLWLATRLDWTREQFLALINAIACTLVAGIIYRRPSSLLLIYGLLIYGYYIPAMMLTPERLRFSIYIGGLAIYFWLQGRRLIAAVLGVLSVLVHVQVVILYTAIASYVYFPLATSTLQTFLAKGVIRKTVFALIAGATIGALWLFNINPQIQYKLSLYFEDSVDPKVMLAFLSVFALRYVVYNGNAFVFAALSTLTLSFIAAGTYLDRTLVNIYILYFYDFFTAPVRRPVMWLTFAVIFAWTSVKSIGFLGSVQAGLGGYR